MAGVLSLLLLPSETLGRQFKNKTILFEKYPELNAPDLDSCISGLNKNLISYLEYPYTKMNEYSFHQIMELGYYEACQNELGEWADFVTFNSNITHLIGTGRMGLCLPKGCKQHHYDSATTSMLNLVNGFLDHITTSSTQNKGGVIQKWTRVGMSLIKSNEYTESWLGRTSAGVWPTILLLVAISGSTILVNVFKYIRHRK